MNTEDNKELSTRTSNEREERSGVSRRGFLTRASVGAAAVGVISAVPHLGTGAHETEAEASHAAPETLAAPMVAHVRDFGSGEVSVMSGTTERIVRDPKLVARLLRAVRG